MLTYFKKIILGFVLVGFSHICVAYNIEESMNRKLQDIAGKSKNKKQKSPKKIFNGYEVRDKKGEKIGYISKNQNCSVILNYIEDKIKSDDESKNINDIEHLNFKCGGSRKVIGNNDNK